VPTERPPQPAIASDQQCQTTTEAKIALSFRTLRRLLKTPLFLKEPASSTHPDGGAERDRTDDLLLAKQALSQLSYSPNPLAKTGASGGPAPMVGGREWWAREDLNFRPHAYQARALTN
jgi:hypothetical protein